MSILKSVPIFKGVPFFKKGAPGTGDKADVAAQAHSAPLPSATPGAEVAEVAEVAGAAGVTTATTPNGSAARSSAESPGKDPERDLRKSLQTRLGRKVSVQNEGPGTKVLRVATNPYLVLGVAAVGIGVAGVLTAGVPHAVIGAVGATQLSASGSKAIDWWKSKNQGTVYLEPDAVTYLFALDSLDRQVKAMQAVLPDTPGDVHITARQLQAAAGVNDNRRPVRAGPSRLARVLDSPYGRGGLALLSAGLFLIAVTVIPEYVRDASLRVAVAVSAIGGILIATAVVEAFRDVLFPRQD